MCARVSSSVDPEAARRQCWAAALCSLLGFTPPSWPLQVTTLLNKIDEEPEVAPPSPEELAALRERVAQQGEAVKEAKAAAAASKDAAELAAASKEAVAALLKLKTELAKAEAQAEER